MFSYKRVKDYYYIEKALVVLVTNELPCSCTKRLWKLPYNWNGPNNQTSSCKLNMP
jgi:hypothetical protein